MEAEPDKEVTDEPLLRFVLDGVVYSLKQNVLTRKEAWEKLTKWFPDAVIVLDEPKDGKV